MGMNLDEMGVNEWLLIAGTVVGPIVAVQAQKWVERLRDGKRRREWVFLQLMATRQQRLSADHVRALNSIDIAFYGSRVLGRMRRIAPYQEVLDSWTIYRDHLTPPDDVSKKPLGEQVRFEAKAQELFINLLEKLAVATGFDFKRGELQSGSYSPIAHGTIENENTELRARTLSVLRGEHALPLDVRSMPSDPVVMQNLLATQARFTAAVERIADSLMAVTTSRQQDSGAG